MGSTASAASPHSGASRANEQGPDERPGLEGFTVWDWNHKVIF